MGLRLVIGTGIQNDFGQHIHDDCCVGIILSGRRKMIIGSREYPFAEGDVFIINPGEPHTVESDNMDSHSYAVLIIPAEIISGFASDLYGEGTELVFNNAVLNDAGISDRFRAVINAFREDDSSFEGESAFYSLIAFLARYHSQKGIPDAEGNDNKAVNAARKFIDENFRDVISLELLSDIAGVSPFHLNRMFSLQTGMSPHSYMIHKRIESSKRLLLEGYSIAFVSAESGFSDQSHFTRFFKKITGTTPGRFVGFNSLK